MAKNNDKKDVKPIDEKEPEMITAPEKVHESSVVEKKQEERKPLKPEPFHETPKHNKPEPPHKKQHSGHSFVIFIFLCLLGGLAFFALQFEQTKQQNTATLNKLQAAYEEKIDALNYKIGVLDTEVTNLKNRPIVEHAAGISENQLNQKIAALRDEMAYQLEQIAAKRIENIDSESGKKENNVSVNVAEMNALAAVKSVVTEEKTIREVLLASGAIMVRDLAEQGMNFAYEAEVLQILAQGNELAAEYVRIVRHYANSGVSGKNQLIRNFNKIFAELNQARTKVAAQNSTEDKKWYEKVAEWIKSTIVVKRGGGKPVFAAENDEVLELVHDGRLQDALNELKISEKYAKVDSQPLNEWQAQVLQYLDFDKAISGLIMNSLANIRLKEMEHAAQ